MGSRQYSVSVACPAKINLNLFILARREDGFHDLHSIVAQTSFGDRLDLQWDPRGNGGEDVVIVDGAIIPEADNTVLAAIRRWRLAKGVDSGSFRARLTKKIPLGAGLGGGSSDAAAVLKAIRSLELDEPADASDWLALAAEVGSDCPLFMSPGASLMEGRGERITSLEASLAGRLSGQEVILFKPRFSISTAEAYSRLSRAGLRTDGQAAEAAFQTWAKGDGMIPSLPLPGNDFERLLEGWIPSIPILLKRLREKHGIDARLTGSGSACFAFPGRGPSDKEIIEKEMCRAWGEVYWMQESIIQ
ncbi:MAG: hypothetical protein R6V45_07825 [Oceanipulchritudo sp.]